MYGWHCEYSVEESEEDHAEDANLRELRNKCYAESTRLLIEAIRGMQSEYTDLETISLKIRKATEYIQHDLYYYTQGIPDGNPKPRRIKKRQDWYDKSIGFGKHIDKNIEVRFNTALDASKLGIHPEVETVQSRDSLDLALDCSLVLYVWWVKNFTDEGIPDLLSEMKELGRSAWASNEPLYISDFTDEDEDEGDFRGYGDDDWGDEDEDESEDESDLLKLAMYAITINGGSDRFVRLTEVKESMLTIDPDYSPRRKEGFHTTLQMMLKFQEHIMVARDKDNHPLVKIRGLDDPPPPWAYRSTPLKILIRDAINQIADQYGWAYTMDLSASIKRLFPDFKVSDYGYSSLRTLIRNLGGYMFEYKNQGKDSRVRNGPVNYLTQAILATPGPTKMGDWAECDDVQKVIDDTVPMASPDRYGLSDVQEMAIEYETYFEYSFDNDYQPQIRIRPWKTDLIDAIRSNISSLADQDGWAMLATLGDRLTRGGFEPSKYGYANLTYLIEDMLDDEVEFNKKSGNSGGHKVRIKVPVDYEGMTVKQLTEIARERGLSRYSKLRKADLIELIRANESD
jgi:Skp family chaperone for outer membrane proteins